MTSYDLEFDPSTRGSGQKWEFLLSTSTNRLRNRNYKHHKILHSISV